MKKDKMLASGDPKVATKNVSKQACCSLIGPQDTHAKRSPETILDGEIQEMRPKSDENLNLIMKRYEAMEEDLKKVGKVFEELSGVPMTVELWQKERLRWIWREWNATMQPLEDVGRAARRGFLNIGSRLVFGDSLESARIALRADEAENGGNLLADALLVKLGHITDTAIFNDLYGISHLSAQPRLLGKCPTTPRIMLPC